MTASIARLITRHWRHSQTAQAQAIIFERVGRTYR